MIDQSVPKNNNLYAQDYQLWLENTAFLLKNQRFSELDLENLIAEIEIIVKRDKNALISNLRVLLMHLLKCKFKPQNCSNDWLYTIYEHRQRLKQAFLYSPSLKSYYMEVFDTCYRNARIEASMETGLSLSIFPQQCPFSVDETLDYDFFIS